jgi:hypothetical protein
MGKCGNSALKKLINGPTNNTIRPLESTDVIKLIINSKMAPGEGRSLFTREKFQFHFKFPS